MATRYVRHIALALHLAFVIVFKRSLSSDEKMVFVSDMESSQYRSTADTWGERYDEFIKKASDKNATFALHVDVARHCDYVVAIALAERIGGPNGYDLLLAVVILRVH